MKMQSIDTGDEMMVTVKKEEPTMEGLFKKDDVLDLIEVGDTVRSYDFPGMRDDCYVEGEVVGIGSVPDGPKDCVRYHVKARKRIVRGKEEALNEPDQMFYPPVNGIPTLFGGICNGVKKI